MALTILSLQIPAGQSLSNPLEIAHGLRIVRIGMPSSWDQAALTFLVAPDGINFQDLHHAQQSVTGEWVSYPVTIPKLVPNSLLSLPSDAGFNIGSLQLRSGTRQTPVNQSADRKFAMVFG